MKKVNTPARRVGWGGELSSGMALSGPAAWVPCGAPAAHAMHPWIHGTLPRCTPHLPENTMTKKKKAMMRGCVFSCFRTFCAREPNTIEAGQLPCPLGAARGPAGATTRAWDAPHMRHNNPTCSDMPQDRTCQKPMGFLPPFRQAFKYCSLLAVVTRLEVTWASTVASCQPACNGNKTRLQYRADHGRAWSHMPHHGRFCWCRGATGLVHTLLLTEGRTAAALLLFASAMCRFLTESQALQGCQGPARGAAVGS